MKAALAFVLVLCCASAAQASEALKSVMDSYLKIQSSLAADKIDGVKANAAAIATAAAPLGEKVSRRPPASSRSSAASRDP